MAHRERFMQEISPGHFVVACRVCRPKSRNRRHFPSAVECHDWWREHEQSALHQRLTEADSRRLAVQRRRCEERAREAGLDAWVQHYKTCDLCNPSQTG